MQQTDNVVTAWRHGSDSAAGYKNPAGPLYIQGEAATTAALTAPTEIAVVTATSCSYSAIGGGKRCLCC